MRPHGPTGATGMAGPAAVSGEFVAVDGERYYVIRNVDRMPPFFVSVISSADHWLFVSSSGGLIAGRVSPETALFPYLPVDRIGACAAFRDTWATSDRHGFVRRCALTNLGDETLRIELDAGSRFLDVHGQWQELAVPASGLAFTWCQVPVVYRLRSAGRPTSSITRQDGSTQALPQLSLPAALSSQLFRRSGRIRQVSLDFPQHALLGT